jgi:UDP-N-acetylglucosamine--N-acetylmuramyl-(pentapeptide) pyrophosphoryl-undecaprenol N-acetylglucosamine transferase
MKILMVGGGSGGHVTPLKAVAEEISKKNTAAKIEIITDRRFANQTRQIFKERKDIKVKTVFAGKLRRYNGKSFAWHFLHIPTVLKNVGDFLLTILGTLQMLVSFLFKRPDVVFCKGGFVSVPVGVAAHIYRIPLLIHDSDTHAGLSSRILARWANVIATGMPSRYYDYPAEKMKYTGIPVASVFTPVSKDEKTKLKNKLGLDDSPLLLVTGGGLGAERVNSAFERVGEYLISQGWQLVQITGKGKADSALTTVKNLPKGVGERWKVLEFVDLKDYILASDVVVTRTGATVMQELANSQKTAVTIPSRFLTGGHQLKNAKMFEDADAVRVVDEEKLEETPDLLSEVIETVALDKSETMAKNLHEHFAKPEAAADLAQMILDQ